MANFGKPDPTGRSSGKVSGRSGQALKPPKGEPWVWLTRELLSSPAWRAMSPNTARLIQFLLMEHCNHAGRENGALVATYKQLEAYGLSRNCIRAAIQEARDLGLIRCRPGGRFKDPENPEQRPVRAPTLYRLTLLPDRDGNPPTNDWKGKTEEDIAGMRPPAKTDSYPQNCEYRTPRTASTADQSPCASKTAI